MKNIITLSKIGIGAALLTLVSCSNEDPISSKTTFFPIITQNSPETDIIFVEQGEAFTDPGAIATVDDVEIELATNYIGRYRGNVYSETLDTNTADIYTIEYGAENEDGFTGTSTRQVIVAETGDLVNSISGLYRSTVFRNGVQPAANPQDYTDIEYMLIWQNDDGTFEISDAFGGWYLFGRAIADSETPGGIIVANDIPSNDFSFPGTQSNNYFGGSSEITAMTVNPDDKSIDFTTVWQADASTTYTFTVHLEQVQF